jgi:hypothetical protein
LTELKKLDFLNPNGSFVPEVDSETIQDQRLTRLLMENFDNLPKVEQALLSERVARAYPDEKTFEERQNEKEHELMRAIELSGRHGLSYYKLFHNAEGGYDLERLKTVLKRIKQDREDGIHPYVDPALDAELTRKLKKVLRLNIEAQKNKEGAEGEQEEAAGDAGSDEEGAAFSIRDALLKGKNEEE